MPNASEPSGGFLAGGGVLPAPQLMHRQISSKGGKAKTPAKLQAVLRNLAKAKAHARRGALSNSRPALLLDADDERAGKFRHSARETPPTAGACDRKMRAL
jgi:hypothetical protein